MCQRPSFHFNTFDIRTSLSKDGTLVQEFVATLVRQRDMFRQLFEQLSGRQGGGGGGGATPGSAPPSTPAANEHAAGASPLSQQVRIHECTG